jgi:hypothetical protein
MGDEELARVVSQMARNGSVQAAKLRWEMLRSEDGQEHVQRDILDELEGQAQEQSMSTATARAPPAATRPA